MNISIILFVFLCLDIALYSAKADPCTRNFGGCDKDNGLCWTTGRTTSFCSCKAGYKDMELAVHLCLDIDECLEDNVCPENAHCENTEGSYICNCMCGYVMDYTGQHCLEASAINGLCELPLNCELSSRATGPLEALIEFNVKHKDNYYTNEKAKQKVEKPITSRDECECESGLKMNDCGFCVDTNECFEERPCTGFAIICVNTEGSYYCDCEPGYTLGPCKQRCYRRGETIPIICEEPDVERLEEAGVSGRSFVRPSVLPNWRDCAPGVENGDTTISRFDLDFDKLKEMKLIWLCHYSRREGLHSILKLASEEKATWSAWSCWTACKATCWGGLQTRVRKCLNGIPGISGCGGAGSEKRECYSGEKCEFRYRKDAHTLTREERNDLVQAMEKYKKDTTVKGFFNAAGAHGWPFQCDRRSCCHRESRIKFLAWHRTIILNYEQGLTRYLKSKTLGLPYWNWLAEDPTPPDIVWQKTIGGKPNPFAGMTVRIDLPADNPNRIIRRDATIRPESLKSPADQWNQTIKLLNHPYSLHEFAESLESAHGTPHVIACTDFRRCAISMRPLTFSAFDPMFMFHHSQVDHLWAIAQKNLENENNATWTPQTALETLDGEGEFGKRHMPFGNTTINAFPIVQAVNTMRDSYYYEELTGVKYDNLLNNGFPLVGVAQRSLLRVAGPEVLFIGQYLQSVEYNVYINYYEVQRNEQCAQLTNPVAGTLLLGTMNKFKNPVARLTPTTLLYPLDREHNIKACYTTSLRCRSRCAEVRNEPRINSMPDPHLVHYLPNQPVDVYKFQWDAGRKFPTRDIHLDAGFQWIYFYGNRAANIRQVRSAKHWTGCNIKKSRQVKCFGSNGACLLRAGNYYLIDQNQNNCKNGLRLYIVTRK